MPLRPFPYPLGIGTDIVHVKRIHDIVSKAKGNPSHLERFLRRFLTPRERVEFSARFTKNDRIQENDEEIACRHLAGRWAAKEAAIKAVLGRRLSFHDIVILPSQRSGGLLCVILDKLSSQASSTDENSTKIIKPGSQSFSGAGNECRVPSSARDGRARESDMKPPNELSRQHDSTKLGTRVATYPDLQAEEHGAAREGPHDDLDGQIARISISHDGEYATAVCLAMEEPTEEDGGGEAAAREPG